MKQCDLYNSLNANASFTEIQTYVKEVIELRGFSGQSVQESMLLLFEETGELAKAIRKSLSGMSIDETRLYRYDTVESEVADVLIVLLSICNNLGINLYEAFLEKEKSNINRNWTINKESNV